MKKKFKGSSNSTSDANANLTVCHAVTEHKWIVIFSLAVILVISILLGFISSSWIAGILGVPISWITRILVIFGAILNIMSFILGFRAQKCSTEII